MPVDDQEVPISATDAAKADVECFVHTPLDKSWMQIRLLRLSFQCKADPSTPTDAAYYDENPIACLDYNDYRIHCNISTWDLDKAPKFTAISYLWGDTLNPQTIKVNGKALTVRRNCFYALWQFGLHWPTEYVWIDSICINQLDLEEKGMQVSMMARIYASAHRMCACVGDHDAASCSLVELIDLYKEFQTKRPALNWEQVLTSLPPEDADSAIDHRRTHTRDAALPWLWSHGREWMRHFRTVVESFSDRDYWTRLWILQEVRAAEAQNFPILCGGHIIGWHVACYLARLFFNPDAKTNDDGWGSRFNRIWEVEIFARDFADVDKLSLHICAIHRFACSDIRDRVYGTLTILDWKMDGPPIFPDYTISHMDLAWDLVQRLRNATFDNVQFIVRGALGIDMEDAAIRDWFRAKRASITLSEADDDLQYWTDGMAALPAVIYLNAAGEMCTDLRGWRSPVTAPTSERLCTEELRGSTIQIAAKEARPGDLLLQTDHFSLVLRYFPSHPRHHLVLGTFEHKLPQGHEITEIDLDHIQCSCFDKQESVNIWDVKFRILATAFDAMEIVAWGEDETGWKRVLKDNNVDVSSPGEFIEEVEIERVGNLMLGHLVGLCPDLEGGRVEKAVPVEMLW